MARNPTTSKCIFSSNALQVHDDFVELGQTFLIVHSALKM